MAMASDYLFLRIEYVCYSYFFVMSLAQIVRRWYSVCSVVVVYKSST